MALGQQIVRELEFDEHPNTLRRWMAHHLAEQLHRAEYAEGAEREAVEDRAVALILKIWASRRDAPGKVDPLRRLENVLAVMDRMRPEAWPFRGGRGDRIADLLVEAFDGLRTLVWAGVLLTQWEDQQPVDAGAATEFLDGDERAVIDEVNEWAAFVQRIPSPGPMVRIVTSEEEAAALEAEDKREAEIDALPDPDRALQRLDQQLSHLLETIANLKAELATFNERDEPEAASDALEANSGKQTFPGSS